jgi:hypothetical protein
MGGWLAELRRLDMVEGCAVGVAGTPGRFFLVAKDVLKHASLNDYREMITDRHSVAVSGRHAGAMSR